MYDTRLVYPFLSGAYPEDIIPKGQYLHLPTYFQVIDPLHIITWHGSQKLADELIKLIEPIASPLPDRKPRTPQISTNIGHHDPNNP